MLNFKRSTNVVPVQLLGFNATKQQNKSLLQWQTANELNSQGFEIQRSANASNWTAIGFVNSAGATAGNYSFTDIAPLHKINYYRLKQVDINGSFTNSEIKFLDFSKNSRFLFYPNPVVNEIKIITELDFNNVPFRIYSASGQLALQTKLNASGVATIPVAQLPKGSYVAEIIVNNIPEKIKFIKE
ncbi:MAG: T9SS type A sorting domain-containing protein [Chitinophagaceae bacterium]|nr:T9SS type A sorting domain-containing protein [Chitinophagaceae bacterium]